MSSSKPLSLVVAAAVIDADGRVLIQTRPKGLHDVGMWEFPGGKIDAGETPESALVRELHEELGIVTIEKALFPLSFVTHEFPEAFILMPLYGVRNWTGTVEAKDGQELAWVRPARLADYRLRPSNVPLIAPLTQLI